MSTSQSWNLGQLEAEAEREALSQGGIGYNVQVSTAVAILCSFHCVVSG